MSIITAPTDEEKYLLAILDGPDGLDLAEFAYYDNESSDGCYRAWDFQWEMYTCDDMFQVEQGARAVGKTMGIVMRTCAFPFNFPGQKMLLTAPELNHLRPLTDAIENRLTKTRFVREMLPETKSHGMARQPHWQCSFKNGSQLVSRLPNKDGKGVKGQHVIAIEQDEAQDYPLAGWTEMVETLNRGLPGAMWRAHGVPKGVRDKFYDITEGSADDTIKWTVHRPMAMQRPTWSEDERNEKIQTYGGSRQNTDYKRNIYGEHGDQHASLFVLARLLACVDTDEGSVYNNDVYTCVRIEHERLPEGGSDQQRQLAMEGLLSAVPGVHKGVWSQKIGTKEVGAIKGYSAYYGGADIGVTNHPSEFLIVGQRTGTDHLDLLLRVNLQRINTDDQEWVVEWLFNFYGPKLKSFALDKTGVGWSIWDQLSRFPNIAERISGFNFSEKRVVGFEDRPLKNKETKADLAIMRNVVEAATDWLRNDYVDAGNIRLPFDKELLLEFQGQTYTTVRDTGDPYGKKRLFGGGASYHTLDAAKMIMAGMFIPALEAMLVEVKPKPVLDVFMGEFM